MRPLPRASPSTCARWRASVGAELRQRSPERHGVQPAVVRIAADLRRLGLRVAPARVLDDARRAAHGAHDGAEPAALRIVQRGADRLREFARLAAELPVAPAGFFGQAWKRDAHEELAVPQCGREKAGDETLQRRLAPSLWSLNDCKTPEE